MKPAVTDALLSSLREAVAFEPTGESAGNVTVGRGTSGARAVHVALVENRVASGSIGNVEAKRLAALFRIVAAERSPLVLYLDSAGAKVSEGLAALGAFRHLFHDGLAAAASAAPIAALLGKNCYGGASMLAHLACARLFGAGTQLAMSGPSIIAASAGMNVFDEMFRAMAEASMSAASRAKASDANTVWNPGDAIDEWLAGALRPGPDVTADWRARHEALARRLPAAPSSAAESVQRRDLAKLFEQRCELREAAGVLTGEGERDHGPEKLLGIVGKSPLGAERAWRFADEAWRLCAAPPPRLRVLLDCATHAARLEDERIVLSEYIVGMSLPLALLGRQGTAIELTVLGEAGGGVYVALAGPAARVSALYGAQIRVLPGSALTAILGEGHEDVGTAAEYGAAGVAEEEIRLGLVPDAARNGTKRTK